MKFSLFSAVLFSIGWMSVVTGEYPPGICCLTVSNTRVPVENIVKYEMQEPPLCTLRAVIFYTKKSIAICSDPDSKWAQRAMDIVDGRTTAKPMCYTNTKKTETSTSDGRPGDCCLTLSTTKPPIENIVKYEMQDSTTICPLKAVIFHTKRGIAICSDPDSKYAKRVMEKLGGRTTVKSTMCHTSTTDTIPAVTTTNKTPGKKTGTRNGGLESFTESIHVTTTTIPVKYILKNLRSRNKKGLRKFQAGIWHRMQKRSVAEE